MTPKILFVDDNPASMAPYRDCLKKNGYHVIERSRVDEALKALDGQTFDLLVLDLMMPPGELLDVVSAAGMDTGKHLYVRAREKDRFVPVIIFTNVDDDVDLGIYQDDPNLQVFRKEEYLPSELASKIGEILWARKRAEPKS